MNYPLRGHMRLPLVGSATLLLMSIMFLFSSSSTASAAEYKFCWGNVLQEYQQGCEDSTPRWIDAVYGSGANGSICVGVPLEGLDCTGNPGEGVYVNFPNGTVYGKATIYNFHGAKNTVYGTVWDTAAPPPPPPPPPPPTWHNENLGGTITSDPDIASWGSGRLDIFASGSDNTLHTKYFSSNKWSNWAGLGSPSMTSGPGAVSWGNGRVDVVARASDNSVTHWWYDGSWHNENLGGTITSDPDIASWGSGRLDVFARGTNNSLHTKYFANNKWSSWIDLKGPSMTSGPGAVSWGNGRVDVVARASDNSVTHWWYDGSWHNENLGGTITSDPDIASWGSGRLDVFARGTNNLLHTKYFADNKWSSWIGLGGPTMTSGPGAVSWENGRVDVVARAGDNSVAHWWYAP